VADELEDFLSTYDLNVVVDDDGSRPDDKI
jgi:hypothetical protein